MDEQAYRRVTYDLTVSTAGTLAKLTCDGVHLLCRARARRTERGRMMWARVKGKTKNALLQMPFKAAYCSVATFSHFTAFEPRHGVRSCFNAIDGAALSSMETAFSSIFTRRMRGPRDAEGC